MSSKPLNRALQRTGTRAWLRRSVVIFCPSVLLGRLSVGCRSLYWTFGGIRTMGVRAWS